LMAGAYRALPASWWAGFPGALIPGKVLAIVALVVVFITCPLFRHCSPVQGVCDLDDLEGRGDGSDGLAGSGGAAGSADTAGSAGTAGSGGAAGSGGVDAAATGARADGRSS